MGNFCSVRYHPAEKEMFVKDLAPKIFAPQPIETFADLETENDMKGKVAVDHIFTNTRDVYGQPPTDMEDRPIDWESKYKISLGKRPSPYDFPAFEHEKPQAEGKSVMKK